MADKYKDLVESLAKIIKPGEFEEYEKLDWGNLLDDVKKVVNSKEHETATAEAILENIPEEQASLQKAVKLLLSKAWMVIAGEPDEKITEMIKKLWYTFECMDTEIIDAIGNIHIKNIGYSLKDEKENRMLLDFIRELREIQWKNGEVLRVRKN